MVFLMYTKSYIVLTGALLTLFAFSVHAEAGDRASVFAKGTQMTPFAPALGYTAKSDAEYFPRTNVSDPKSDFVAEESPKTLAQVSQSDELLNKLPPKDRLLAKYGDPAKNTPVLAIENAPAPFKAMMESLQEGQDELAFQYAKQYVRYLGNVQERTTRVQSLVGFAQKKENMIEDGELSNGPALVEDKAIFEKDAGIKSSPADEAKISASAESIMKKGKAKLAAETAKYHPIQNPTTVNFKEERPGKNLLLDDGGMQ